MLSGAALCHLAAAANGSQTRLVFALCGFGDQIDLPNHPNQSAIY